MISVRHSPAFYKMRDLFETSLDSTWFEVVAERTPLDLHDLHLLREFLYSRREESPDAFEVAARLTELEKMIEQIRIHLLPVIKEKLGISYLAPQRMVGDRDQLVLRQFVAYTLPYNLEELRRLAQELRRDCSLARAVLA